MDYERYKKGKGNFKADLEQELGWDKYPPAIRNQMYDYCYEHGHYAGHEEVYAYATGMNELFEGVAEMYEATVKLHELLKLRNHLNTDTGKRVLALIAFLERGQS